MSDVFISYSRKDKVFARRLFERLKQENFASWMDWANIQGGSHWWEDIKTGIEGANNFIFIISPDSYTSGICHREIEHALQNGKRIIPIVRREVSKQALAGQWIDKEWESLARDNYDTLAALDYVFFRKKAGFDCEYDDETRDVLNPDCDQEPSDADDFETAFAKLFQALNQDPENARLHTRYFLRAKEWADNQREDSLLIGTEINEAEAWLAQWERMNAERLSQTPPLPPLKPEPLDLHRQYITISREAETRRTNRLRSIRRASIGAGLVAVVAFVFAIGAFLTGQDTQRRADIASTQAVDAEFREANALTAVAAANSTLQPIVSTSTAVAQQLETNFAILQQNESQRLAALADSLFQDENGNNETAALLAIKALQTDYSPQAEYVLTQLLRENDLEHVFYHPGTYSVAISPDGQYVVTGAGDGTIRLWSSRTGEIIREYTGHESAQELSFVSQLIFHPFDNQIFASVSADDTTRLWYVDTVEPIHVLQGHESLVLSVDFSPDGLTIATSSSDKTLRFWDVESGQLIGGITFETDVNEVKFSPDGQFIIGATDFVTGLDGRVVMWDISSGIPKLDEMVDPIREFVGHEGRVTTVDYSSDGEQIVSGSTDGTIRFWNIQTGEQIAVIAGHEDWVNSVAYSPDDQYIVSASRDDSIKLWNARSGELVRTYWGDHTWSDSVSFSRNGKYILGTGHLNARMWHVEPETPRIFEPPIQTSGLLIRINDAVFHPDGQHVYSASGDGSVIEWEFSTGKPLGFRGVINGDIEQIALSPDGSLLALLGWDPSLNEDGWIVQLRNADNGRHVKDFKVFGGVVEFSPDGQFLLMPDEIDSTILIMRDVIDYEVIQTFVGHEDSIVDVVYLSDGKTIITASADGTVKLWETATGENHMTIPANPQGFTSDSASSLAISSDDRLLAIGTDAGTGDGKIIIWNLQENQAEFIFDTPSSSVGDLSFSPDGRYLAASTMQVWEVETGEQVRVLGDGSPVNTVVFSPDGQYIVTGDSNNYLYVWNADLEGLIEYACSRVYYDLTEEERQQYGIIDDEPTCPPFAAQ